MANLPLVAKDDTFQVPLNGSLNIPADALTDDVSDPDNSSLTFSVVPDSAGHTTTDGTLVFNSNGSFTYTPETGYDGLDSFQYVANDGTQNSNPATVVIAVGSAEYTALVVATPPTAMPSNVNSLPNSLKTLWLSWQASEDRLAQVDKALAVYKQDLAAVKTLDPTTAAGIAASDKAKADLQIAGQAYDNCLQQDQATVSLEGTFLSSVSGIDLADAEAISAISVLPLDIAALNRYQNVLGNPADLPSEDSVDDVSTTELGEYSTTKNGLPSLGILPSTNQLLLAGQPPIAQSQAIGALNAQAAAWNASGYHMASAFMQYYASGGGGVYLLSSQQEQTLKQEITTTAKFNTSLGVALAAANPIQGVFKSVSGIIHCNYTSVFANSDLANAFGSIDLAYTGKVMLFDGNKYAYSLTFTVKKHYNFTLGIGAPEHDLAYLWNSVFPYGVFLEDCGYSKSFAIGGSFSVSGFLP